MPAEVLQREQTLNLHVAFLSAAHCWNFVTQLSRSKLWFFILNCIHCFLSRCVPSDYSSHRNLQHREGLYWLFFSVKWTVLINTYVSALGWVPIHPISVSLCCYSAQQLPNLKSATILLKKNILLNSEYYQNQYTVHHVQCPFTAPGANLHLFMFFLGPQTAACPVINMQFVAQLSWETVRELQINQGVDF